MALNLLHKRADPGWLRETSVWVERQLTAQNRRPTGPGVEVRVLPWSAVFRFPTAAGDVYFKACAPSQGFEPALARILAERRPDDVLPVLAADLERAWLLLPDGGPVLRYVLRNDMADLGRHWSAILPQVAAMQVALTDDARHLLSLGVLDRRPSVLPALFREVLERDDWPLDHPDSLSRDDLPRIRAFAPRLDDLCAELAALGPADTLVHDDFHDGHVFVQGDPAAARYRFFDFGDACVGHPFFQMVAPQRFYARAYDELEVDDRTVESLYELYMSAWLPDGPPASRRQSDGHGEEPARRRRTSAPDLWRALDLALAVGPLIRALTWVHALGPHYPDIEPELMAHYACGVCHWLRELEARSQRLT